MNCPDCEKELKPYFNYHFGHSEPDIDYHCDCEEKMNQSKKQKVKRILCDSAIDSLVGGLMVFVWTFNFKYVVVGMLTIFIAFSYFELRKEFKEDETDDIEKQIKQLKNKKRFGGK